MLKKRKKRILRTGNVSSLCVYSNNCDTVLFLLSTKVRKKPPQSQLLTALSYSLNTLLVFSFFFFPLLSSPLDCFLMKDVAVDAHENPPPKESREPGEAPTVCLFAWSPCVYYMIVLLFTLFRLTGSLRYYTSAQNKPERKGLTCGRFYCMTGLG